jgi:hypothetical protein
MGANSKIENGNDMTKAKKAEGWIEKGWTDALGVKDLWIDIKEKLDTIGYEENKDRGFDAETNPSSSIGFTVGHPDGRRIKIERDGDRIVIEAAERRQYDKKVQGRLRRSFVEPKAELLAKEIIRQFELLLAAYTPIWNEREDVKARLTQERKTRHARAIELSEILAKSKKGRKLAVGLPDPDEDHEYEAAKIRFLLEDHDPKPHELTKGSIQVGENGTNIEIDGPVTPALAAALADVLSNYVAAKIKCSSKGCGNEHYAARGLGLSSSDKREAGKCDIHGQSRRDDRDEED